MLFNHLLLRLLSLNFLNLFRLIDAFNRVKLHRTVQVPHHAAYFIQIDEPFVNQIFANSHLLGNMHVLSFPVTQLGITCCARGAGLADHELAKLVAEKLLTT